MSGTCWGPLTVIRGNTVIELPRVALKPTGQVKKAFTSLITGSLTVHKQVELEKLGAVVRFKTVEVM